MLQTLIVALLVVACVVYASWTLMPAAARRALARSLLRLAPPEPLAAKLRRAAAASAGCGCDGCDHAPAKAAPKAAPQIVTFHRRARP